VDDSCAQMSLGEALAVAQSAPTPAAPQRRVAAHTRSLARKKADTGEDSLPFFDETRVPVEVIDLPAPETEGLAAQDYEIIGHKESYRLAQRPGATVVLKYRRPVIKLKAEARIVCPSAPPGVIEGSRAEVSFIAGLLIDKFAYHLPLYRQHQRLTDNGIAVSRAWLTQLGSQAIGLLDPLYEAQLASIRASRVKAMDETPIKAGRGEPGKLKAAYFWPVYGQLDEVCFPFFESRRAELCARHVGIMHSLIVTCRLHQIDPYDYLVDVLQRVGQHPASRVHELTPRLWKTHFAANPLRSAVYKKPV